MQLLCILLILCSCRMASAQVILSEVMYNPRLNDNAYEFIEIFNTSLTDTVSLFGWQIGDQTETDSLISSSAFYRLGPQQFAVVLDRDYFATTRIYDSLIPSQALILTINDNTLGSAGLSNSTAETVVLLDAAGKTAASYAYSLGNADGISDEKIFLDGGDVPGNWANSQRADGTPGQHNSASPAVIDGELVARSFQFAPAVLREGQIAKLNVTVRNSGLHEISSAVVEFWIIGSSAVSPLPSRLGVAETPATLKYTDTVGVTFEWNTLVAGRHALAAILILPNDARPGNDTLRANLAIGHRRNTVLISEIMFAPPAGQPEWIEVFNPQSTALSLADWQLEDEDENHGVIPPGVMIPAWGYLVLARNATVASAFRIADSLVVVPKNFPSLNNDGDVLRLCDFSGGVIDSVAYQENWGAPRISAEKVWYERDNVTANWQPSQDDRGGTPAALNSVSPRDLDVATIRLQFDPPKPAAGDDVHFVATVLNRGRHAVDRFVVTFANDRNEDGELQNGEEIGATTIAQTLPVEDSIVVRQLWSQPFSGRHQILTMVAAPLDMVRANDRLSARLSVGYSARNVVINEIYYAPRSGEMEWVEFFNRSSQPVDLSTWRWRDAGADFPLVFPDSALILAPGEFVLLSAGRNISQVDFRARLIVPKTWLALNNDSDQLVLEDFHGRVQDSLAYSQNWGGDGGGVSLERINPHLASTDSSNWNSCVDPAGSTPGKPNSIFTEFMPSQASVAVSPQPFSPDGDGHDDFAIIQIQTPATTATAHLKIYDVRGRLVHQLLNNAPISAMHQVIWNGRDDDDRPVATGIYILYLQAINAVGGVLVEARSTLVLARRLN